MGDLAHKRAYDRAYRLAHKDDERLRRRAFDRKPLRLARRIATTRYRYRRLAISRMEAILVAS